MITQLIIGFTAEGTTDCRFLESIIQRTFEEVAFDCDGQIDVLPVQFIRKGTGRFEDCMVECAKKASNRGVMVFCIHTDADDRSDEVAFKNRVLPAFEKIYQSPEDETCQNLIAIVPVQMIEAWMLADVELIKGELNTTKSDKELGIERNPESYADPKMIFKDVIRIAFEDYAQRRKRPEISEFYQLIGQKIALTSLEKLPSYIKFKNYVIEMFRKLNLLR